MRKVRYYYVYIMQSSSRRALYIGITSDLEHRVWQHKNSVFYGFSSDYKTYRLVYFERFSDVTTAIAREKQLKNWRRSKKEWLVTTMNPEWKDLSAEWSNTTDTSLPRNLIAPPGWQPQGPSTRGANSTPERANAAPSGDPAYLAPLARDDIRLVLVEEF
jgi:putative endonuclease